MSDPDDELRQLLRGLAVTERIPDDVADRLDQTLDRLVATRVQRPTRRIGRVVAIGAVAASAVGVVAFGVTALTHLQASTSGSAASAEASSLARPNSNADPSVAPTIDAASSSLPEFTSQAVKGSQLPTPSLVRIPSFPSAGLAEALRTWWTGSPSYDSGSTCAGPWLSGPARTTPAILDGSPAALLVFPPQDGSQTLQIFLCGSPETPVAEIEVPSP